MFSEGRVAERWRLFASLLVATLLGMVTRQFVLCYLLVLVGYLIWHIRQFNRIEGWLAAKGDERDAPLVFGLWSDFLNHIFRQQRQNQKQLQRLDRVIERFQNTLDTLPDATVVLDAYGSIRWANPAAERFFGVRNPGDIGQRLSNLVRDLKLAELLSGDRIGESINIVSPVDDSVHLNVRMVPYRGSGERLLTARDVSDLMRADQMRRDFVSNASHELKTPLTVMSGYLELLQNTPGMEEDVLSLLRSTEEQTRRMRHLVDDLLMLSRLESGGSQRKESVAMASMLESMVGEARQLSGEMEHRISLEADPSLMVEGNYRDLVSAASNLIFNAVNHTPPGTEIRVSWQREGNNAVLRVIDSGPGIDAWHLPRLTERFYRVEAGRERRRESGNEGRGTGLGLAIVKHIVQAHGGRLEIVSERGKGAEFSCKFPI
ncbi:MAG: phosphate regulon sensor histidine kinase PhoR [Pseudomonadota bacterium]